MKSNKWLKIILGIIVAIIITGILTVYILVNKGYGISVGRYLESKNGTPMLICENSPITMSNRTSSDVFNKLDIGDEIIVVHTGIAESYPAQTGVYAVFRLSKGTTLDIPQKVINELVKLGWLDSLDAK